MVGRSPSVMDLPPGDHSRYHLAPSLHVGPPSWSPCAQGPCFLVAAGQRWLKSWEPKWEALAVGRIGLQVTCVLLGAPHGKSVLLPWDAKQSWLGPASWCVGPGWWCFPYAGPPQAGLGRVPAPPAPSRPHTKLLFDCIYLGHFKHTEKLEESHSGHHVPTHCAAWCQWEWAACPSLIPLLLHVFWRELWASGHTS